MTEEELNKVKEFVLNKSCNIKDLQHDCEHAKRVAKNALKIVNFLKLNGKIDLNLLQATCFLHDINYSINKPTLANYFLEGKRTKTLLPKILSDLKVGDNEKIIIQNAICSSSFSFPFGKLNKNNDLYSQILQDADTIDFFSKEREICLNKSKKRFLFYKILAPFSKKTLYYGRNNLKKYLNFPQLAKENYVPKN